MKTLFPPELAAMLPPLYSQENEPDPMVMVKFFHPLSHWTWYASEGSPVDANGYYDTDQEKVDFLFFGWVYGDVPELGYFSLNELKSVNVMGLGIERDQQFTPMKLSEVKQLHSEPPPVMPTLTIYVVIDDLGEEEPDEQQ